MGPSSGCWCHLRSIGSFKKMPQGSGLGSWHSSPKNSFPTCIPCLAFRVQFLKNKLSFKKSNNTSDQYSRASGIHSWWLLGKRHIALWPTPPPLLGVSKISWPVFLNQFHLSIWGCSFWLLLLFHSFYLQTKLSLQPKPRWSLVVNFSFASIHIGKCLFYCSDFCFFILSNWLTSWNKRRLASLSPASFGLPQWFPNPILASCQSEKQMPKLYTIRQ